MSDKLGIFSFFSGAGFLDLGFEQTRKYDILFVNEIHKPFMDIYKFSRISMGVNPPVYGHSISDITSFLKDEKLEKLCKDVEESRKQYKYVGFIGGPPCPDFSVGGKNKGKKGENGKLSGTYANLICRAKPDFFLFENVKGLYRTQKHREFFDTLKKRFIRNGYYLTEKLINAIEYGTPQDRERIILLGFKKSVFKGKGISTKDSYLTDFDWNSFVKYDKNTTFEESWPEITPYIENSTMTKPHNITQELTVEYWFNKNHVDDHYNSKRFFTPKEGLKRFREIQEGDDKKKSYKRLHRWRYSPTAAYGNNEVHLHPYKSRRLSAAEALAIQSLPEDYKMPNDITLSDTFKAIGNGVPFLVAEGLANNIFEFIKNQDNDTKTNR
ncbi:MAG: DNA cytosine methyltransferase [Dysgonomonas sp.]|nr:DNA cytosine methyltransferase [Dysgonomonas sp.]